MKPRAVKIITGSAAVTTDTTVSSDKTYYAVSGIGYVKVTPASGDKPQDQGLVRNHGGVRKAVNPVA